MKNYKDKVLIYVIYGVLAWVGLAMASCTRKGELFLMSIVKAPEATIEKGIKGHEQIYSVQIILRYAHLRDANKQDPKARTYSAYGIPSQKGVPIPLYQEIGLSKDDDGQMVFTTERKHFDVVKGKDIYYGLELKYFDINDRLINHQFSGYYPDEDMDNSTLIVHQHFFTIQNYALGSPTLIYPMTLDGYYYDKYLFGGDDPEPSTLTSVTNVFVPTSGYVKDKLQYDPDLALEASNRALTEKVLEPYIHPTTNESYKLYKAANRTKMNEYVKDLFAYEYRDTDPVEEILGSVMSTPDDLGRKNRVGGRVIRLRKERSLLPGADLDALGFKGILQFRQSNVDFQMRICICHIITAEGKYDLWNTPGGLHAYYDLSQAWNSFDIDYPIRFRVIADVDGDREQCIQDIQKEFPAANTAEIEKMFWDDPEYFRRIPQITM